MNVTDLLLAVRKSIESRYMLSLGRNVRDSLDNLLKEVNPCWTTLTRGLHIDGMADEQPIGALLDPEIGIIHLFSVFTQDSDIRAEIVRALGHRSQLRRERGLESRNEDLVDPTGAWRIVIVWLVEDAERQRWMDRISEIREDTGFSEELTLDVIFYSHPHLTGALERHRFPRLLLAVRQVMSIPSESEALAWRSADRLVKDSLNGFAQSFVEPGQKELARLVENMTMNHQTPAAEWPQVNSTWTQGKAVSSFRVENFRSVGVFDLRLASEEAGAAIIYGPNGTGKSSIAEAISIALFGTSYRFAKFAIDSDITERNAASSYEERYMRSLDMPTARPRFRWGSDDWRELKLDPAKVEANSRSLEANVLTQEESFRFVNYTSSELAARVLRGYSDLADSIEQAVEEAASKANERRQSYLRDLGLSVGITKIETIKEKIALAVLAEMSPAFPASVRSWLESISNLPGTPFGNLSERIQTWEGTANRTKLAKELSDAHMRRDIKPIINAWLRDYRDLAARLRETIGQVQDRMGTDPERIIELTKSTEIWGTWLEQRKKSVPKEPKLVADSAALRDRRGELEEVRRRGREVRERRDVLQQVKNFVDHSWGKGHLDECPACGATYLEQGGYPHRLSVLLSECEQELERLIPLVERLRHDVESAQEVVAKEGSAENPVGERERIDSLAAFQWLTTTRQDYEEILSDAGQRTAMLALASSISHVPAIPAGGPDIDELVVRCAELLESKWREAAEVFEEPNNWASVQKQLTSRLSAIIQSHLPDTVATLWLELILSLTSASWVNSRMPEMKAEPKRKKKTVRLDLEDRLARYILNQSEAHLLGLAWFIADYFLRGRYVVPLMLLDDPSQEMDETTYREFCRFMETIVRMHKRMGYPLALVVMLHQESRAIELARACAARFYSLSWRDSQSVEVGESSVVDESLFPRNPAVVLSSQ